MLLDLSAFLTPHNIVLAALTREYAQRQQGGAMPELALELALYLVQEIKPAAHCTLLEERALHEVLIDLENLAPGGADVAHALNSELQLMKSPDDLFVFLEERLQKVVGRKDSPIERNSVLDIFLRKVLLGLRTLPFDRFCELFTRVVEYRDTQAAGQITNASFLHQPPPLSAADIQAHVHHDARLLEESTSSLDFDQLDGDIALMVGTTDKVPKVLYLKFLRAMHGRDFQQALDNLHHYFDIATGVSGTGGVSVQYAVLNLAVLHLHFGHLDEAMHAINETVRVAQQSNDSNALAFAVSWLLRTVQAQNNARDAHSLTSYDMREEQRLLRRCFCCASEEELPHLACLTALACGRHALTVGVPEALSVGARAEIDGQMDPLPATAWACQAAARKHARRALAAAHRKPALAADGIGRRDCASAHSFNATVWEWFGHTTLASAMAHLQRTSYGNDGFRHDTVNAACLVARQDAAQGRFSDAFATLREAYTILPPPNPLVPRVTLGVLHARALARLQFSAAEAAVGELRALSASSANAADAADARLCAAQLELARHRLQLAFREATALLDLHRCRGHTADLVPVLLLLAEVHQNADSAVVALPHVLSALSLCDAFSMEQYRGYAVTMLAELQLRLGATTQAIQLLDNAMPQLLEHAPVALQAHAQQILGRGRLALASSAPTDLAAVESARAAATSLEQSMCTYRHLGAHQRAREAAYLLARTYHTLIPSGSTGTQDYRAARNRCAAAYRWLSSRLTSRSRDDSSNMEALGPVRNFMSDWSVCRTDNVSQTS